MTLNVQQPQANIPLTSRDGRVMPTWAVFFKTMWEFLFLNNGVLNPFVASTGGSQFNQNGAIVFNITEALVANANVDLDVLTNNQNYNGKTFRFIRTAASTGNYAVIFLQGVAVKGKLHRASTWIDFHFDGTNWIPTASGDFLANTQYAAGPYLLNQYETVLTGNTDYTLAALSSFNLGTLQRVTRTAASTGAFNLNVKNHNGTLIKALATSTWVDCYWDSTNWVESAYGAL